MDIMLFVISLFHFSLKMFLVFIRLFDNIVLIFFKIFKHMNVTQNSKYSGSEANFFCFKTNKKSGKRIVSFSIKFFGTSFHFFFYYCTCIRILSFNWFSNPQKIARFENIVKLMDIYSLSTLFTLKDCFYQCI